MASEKTLKEWRVFWVGSIPSSHSEGAVSHLHLDGGGSGGWPHKVGKRLKKVKEVVTQLITGLKERIHAVARQLLRNPIP